MNDNANVKEKLMEIFNKLYELEMDEIDKVRTRRLETVRLIDINKCLYYVAEELSEMLNKLCAFLCVQMAEESHVTVDKVDRTIREMVLSENMKKLRYSVFDKSEKVGLDPLLAMVYISLLNAAACLDAYFMREMIT